MTYWGLINYEKLNEWKLSCKALLLMPVFADLESWASRVKSNDAEDENIYYLLFGEKILFDLPCMGSRASISRALKELEDKEIIKCVHKHSTPAYCLTSKGMEWKRKPDAQKNSNGAAGKNTSSQKQPPKEPSKFQFSKKTSFNDLDKSFIAGDLYIACIRVAADLKIANPKTVYEDFIVHSSANNIAWFNWLSGFKKWCKKHNEILKNSNGGGYGR